MRPCVHAGRMKEREKGPERARRKENGVKFLDCKPLKQKQIEKKKFFV